MVGDADAVAWCIGIIGMAWMLGELSAAAAGSFRGFCTYLGINII